jgi:NAD(P)-dependent dehydrogenase (short-subunit alcohol dehydrogenase family)
MEFENEIAVVTARRGGIGRAVAIGLGAAGADVVLGGWPDGDIIPPRGACAGLAEQLLLGFLELVFGQVAAIAQMS